MNSRRNQGLFVLIFLLFNGFLTNAQSIKGSIIDSQTREAYPAVYVKIKNTNLGAYTNGQGKFTINGVPQGTYNLIANIKGTEYLLGEVVKGEEDIILDDILIDGNSPIKASDIVIVDVMDLAGVENEDDNFSSVLSAGIDPFISAATFNLVAGRFRPRGYFNQESEVLINGMIMNNQDDGRVLWNTWTGMNDVLRNRNTVINLASSDFTFGGVGGASIIDVRASSMRKQKKIVYTMSNRNFQHRLSANYNTGLLNNGWAFSFLASHTYGSQGYIKGTGIQANSYFIGVDKKISFNHNLSFSFLGAPQRRGRATGSIQEMNELAGSNFYNPNWGFQNGEVRSAREFIVHQPISMIRHDWKINASSSLMTTVGVQFGRSGSTRLDWFEAPDPRPDYYRNLPSFSTNPVTKVEITELFKNNEQVRQVNWDRLYAVNAARNFTINDANGIIGNRISGKLAAYVLESENYDNQKLSFNTIYTKNFNFKNNVTVGFNANKEKVHYYRKIEDLLGADFYVDYNRFALTDVTTGKDGKQNDLNRPNRILQEGDKFGHNYEMHNTKYNLWSQYEFKTKHIDYVVAGSLTYQDFYREGLTRVGLFPESSFGKSNKYDFLNFGTKANITYKINNANYLVLNSSYRTRAPLGNEVFVSPRTRDQVVNGLTSEKIIAHDLTYLVRYSNFKARASLYTTDFNDAINSSVFYHEEFKSFVNYVMSNIDRRHSGIEIGLEYSATSKIAIEAALAAGQYFFTDRPLATISRDNSAEDVVKDRLIYAENYYWPASPQVAGTVGLTYRSSKFWTFEVNVNGFGYNYLSFNPDRRTAEAVSGINLSEQKELYNTIIDQERLDDAVTVDFSAGKSIRLRNNSYVRVNLNVSNLLNNTNFRTGGFEQMRYDFNGRNVNAFPPRYFYAWGTNFLLNIAYTFPR